MNSNVFSNKECGETNKSVRRSGVIAGNEEKGPPGERVKKGRRDFRIVRQSDTATERVERQR